MSPPVPSLSHFVMADDDGLDAKDREVIVAAAAGDMKTLYRIRDESEAMCVKMAENDDAFTHAAEFQRYDVMNFLIELGTDVEGNHDALACAAQRGHLRVCEFLIEHGTNVVDNTDAVVYAAENGRLGILELLIQHGADMVNNEEAYEAAVQNNHLEIVDWLTMQKGIVV